MSLKGLTESEIEELQEIFNLVDTDQGGSISQEEVTELLHTLGIKATQDEVDVMIREVDNNSDGEIQFEEFAAVMSRKISLYYTIDQVKDAFRAFSHNAPENCIRKRDIITALVGYGAEKLSKEQALELVNDVSTRHTMNALLI